MNQRLFNIKEIIEKNGKITIKELASSFPYVSEMTIRRDLERLERAGEVLRVPGGAMSIDSVMRSADTEVAERINYKAEEKLEIAEKAKELIERESCIFIDCGSTATYFARALGDEKYYVVTNSMVVAETVLRKEKPSVTLLGGDLRKNDMMTVGKSTIEQLHGINIQTAVMTATGYIKEISAFTCGDQAEAIIKSEIIKHAGQVIMLLDSSKVNIKTPYNFAFLQDVNCMVTDSKFNKELKEEIIKKGVKVY